MGANVSIRLVYVLDEVKLVDKLSIVSSLLKYKKSSSCTKVVFGKV